MTDLAAEFSATVIAQRAYFSVLKTVSIVNERTQLATCFQSVKLLLNSLSCIFDDYLHLITPSPTVALHVPRNMHRQTARSQESLA